MEDESVPSGRTVFHRFELQSQDANGAPSHFGFKLSYSSLVIVLNILTPGDIHQELLRIGDS